MGGFEEKIRRQPCALESGLVRTRQRLLSPDFFIKSIYHPDDEKIQEQQPLPSAYEYGFTYSSLSPLSQCILIFETSQFTISRLWCLCQCQAVCLRSSLRTDRTTKRQPNGDGINSAFSQMYVSLLLLLK